MSYSATAFVENVTVYDAAEGNKMGGGIAAAHVLVDRFNQTSMGAAADRNVLRFDTASGLWVAGGLLATDIPANVRKIVSATTYPLIASDFGKLLHFTAATAITVQIPAGLVTAADATLNWRQAGAGQMTFVGTGGTPPVVVGFGGALKSGGQVATGQVDRIGTSEEYHVTGQTTT